MIANICCSIKMRLAAFDEFLTFHIRLSRRKLNAYTVTHDVRGVLLSVQFFVPSRHIWSGEGKALITGERGTAVCLCVNHEFPGIVQIWIRRREWNGARRGFFFLRDKRSIASQFLRLSPRLISRLIHVSLSHRIWHSNEILNYSLLCAETRASFIRLHHNPTSLCLNYTFICVFLLWFAGGGRMRKRLFFYSWKT